MRESTPGENHYRVLADALRKIQEERGTCSKSDHPLMDNDSKRDPEDSGGVDVFRSGSEHEEVIVVSYPVVPHVPPSLTGCESAVLLLIMRGASNAEIAKEREISKHTVANQIASIFEKMKVNSRSEMASKLHQCCALCTASSCAGCGAEATEVD